MEKSDTLYPIRVPAGWEVIINKLSEIEPDTIENPEDNLWFTEFVEDVLYICQKRKERNNHQTIEHELGIDIGWYPDGNPQGSFHMVVVRDGDWENPLKVLSSRKKSEIVPELEKWLLDYTDGYWI